MVNETVVGLNGSSAFECVVIVEAPLEHAFDVFVKRVHEWWPRPYRLGDGERVALWFESHVGGAWRERTSQGSECDWGRVLTWEPPRRLVLSWEIPVSFTPEPNPEKASRVEVEFIASGPDQTAVRLVHSEFENHGEGWESMRAMVTEEAGWPSILKAYAALAKSR